MIPPPTPSMSHTENRYMFRIWQQFKEKKLMQIKVHKEVEMHREKMAIFKTILMFVWLLTGYFCNSEDLDEEATGSPIVTSAFKKVIKASESEPPQNGIYHASAEKHPLPLIVAGISISLVLLFILVIIGVWYAWKKSKESLAEANSVPSVESGVSLKRISTYEDQCESPFERALQCQQENCCMTLWSVHLYGRTAQTTGLREERGKESPLNYIYLSSTLKRAPSSKKFLKLKRP